MTGERSEALRLLPELRANYAAWEKAKRDPNGLYWQEDGKDGMEVAIGGSGYRATSNSYQFGDALALARIAELAGDVGRPHQRLATPGIAHQVCRINTEPDPS